MVCQRRSTKTLWRKAMSCGNITWEHYTESNFSTEYNEIFRINVVNIWNGLCETEVFEFVVVSKLLLPRDLKKVKCKAENKKLFTKLWVMLTNSKEEPFKSNFMNSYRQISLAIQGQYDCIGRELQAGTISGMQEQPFTYLRATIPSESINKRSWDKVS